MGRGTVGEAMGGREAAGASEVARCFQTARLNLQEHTRGAISNSHQLEWTHALESHIADDSDWNWWQEAACRGCSERRIHHLATHPFCKDSYV